MHVASLMSRGCWVEGKHGPTRPLLKDFSPNKFKTIYKFVFTDLRCEGFQQSAITSNSWQCRRELTHSPFSYLTLICTYIHVQALYPRLYVSLHQKFAIPASPDKVSERPSAFLRSSTWFCKRSTKLPFASSSPSPRMITWSTVL